MLGRAFITCALFMPLAVFAQGGAYPYVLRTFAGSVETGDGGPATAALLNVPVAAASDAAGNLYIGDYHRVRKVTPGGAIATVATVSSTITALTAAPDGTVYFAGSARVSKLSASGAVVTVAGTGALGFSGDQGPAINAQVSSVAGLALDGAGNLYLSDGERIREITLDGNIRTIAGTGVPGFGGDNGPAPAAQFHTPKSLAVDKSNNLYIADYFNFRVRKVTPAGTITTVAGNGKPGMPVTGPATASPLGQGMSGPSGVAVDSSGNLYVGDPSCVVLRIATDGKLQVLAGNSTPYGPFLDGDAAKVSLQFPVNVSVDSAGNVIVVDAARVLQVTPKGTARTVAGRVRFAGDGGPARSALLYHPNNVAVDGKGNVFIWDGGNYRIRKVSPDGTIDTFVGNGYPNYPVAGARANATSIPQNSSAMTADAQGGLYFSTGSAVLKVGSAGTIQSFAGGASGDGTGDGGPATQATFRIIGALAADRAGNVYITDGYNSRVRRVSADGIITNFAGSTNGYSGDGGPATAAQLASPRGLAVDASNNVYVGDYGNWSVRMIAPSGIISTVVGNGTYGGSPKDGQAATAPFTWLQALAADSAGNVYIPGAYLYRAGGGTLRVVAGGPAAEPVEGAMATSVSSFSFGSGAIAIDANDDLYLPDSANHTVWKLVLNSPAALSIVDGDRQAASPGQTLGGDLRVAVNGRAGVPVPGVAVNFTVTSGSAALAAASATTDSAGIASVAVTLGAAPGPVTVTAKVAGMSLSPVQFSLTAVSGTACTARLPSITSVNSATDFGGFSGFASGSWLEIHGENLAAGRRQWSGADFQGANAPTALDGVGVSINGKPAFVGYISAGQINAQAPADSLAGQATVQVTNCAGSSARVQVPKSPVMPGMLAPASFKIAGTQYLAAVFQDGYTFVGNANLIPGVPFRPAAPGETITAYGIGFGAVTPDNPPGMVTAGNNSIPGLTIGFGTTPATVGYAGLAPGAIGLYQFNIVVPSLADGDYPMDIRVGGVKVAQSLTLTVHK